MTTVLTAILCGVLALAFGALYIFVPRALDKDQ